MRAQCLLLCGAGGAHREADGHVYGCVVAAGMSQRALRGRRVARLARHRHRVAGALAFYYDGVARSCRAFERQQYYKHAFAVGRQCAGNIIHRIAHMAVCKNGSAASDKRSWRRGQRARAA